MRIIFINYYLYEFSSGVHIHFIANELTRMGHECTVVLPEVKNTTHFGLPEYTFRNHREFIAELSAGHYGQDTILHAWTTRKTARIPTQTAARALGASYFVHLEDNENHIMDVYLRKHGSTTAVTEWARQTAIAQRDFLAGSSGATVLMDKLAEFVPQNVPVKLIWPACEREFFQIPQAPDIRMRERLGIQENTAVIVYPGNVHDSNRGRVAALYRALPLVSAAGHDIRLIRCSGVDRETPADLAEIVARYVLPIPNIPSRNLPQWLRMADLLVQPGLPDAFDDYRFPSKLPLFLASGRPVVLARTNLGRFLSDGENCLLLEDNTPQAIASRIVWLLEHPEESARIGHNGRKFAARNFSWSNTAKTLLAFYEEYGKKIS